MVSKPASTSSFEKSMFFKEEEAEQVRKSQPHIQAGSPGRFAPTLKRALSGCHGDGS